MERLKQLIELLDGIPEHILAILLVIFGGLVSLLHAQHAFEVGSGLIGAGLTAYKGKSS